MLIVLEVLAALLLLVIAADAFTNSVEWVGALYGLTRSAVGAVVAAVGSSMPETVVAFIALIVLRDPTSQAVGIGAVIGAPFMLATIVFCLIGVTALIRRQRRGPLLNARTDATSVGLAMFSATMAIVLAASRMPTAAVRGGASVAVIALYALYLIYHLRRRPVESEERPPALRFAPRATEPGRSIVYAQLIVALAVTVIAARWFVHSVDEASLALGLPPLLVSIVLSPIATELPEALNVSLWMRRGMDELAVGNVLGAMMFQTSIASAMAMLATPWILDINGTLAAVVALVAALLMLATTLAMRLLGAWPLVACGILYAAYITFVIVRI